MDAYKEQKLFQQFKAQLLGKQDLRYELNQSQGVTKSNDRTPDNWSFLQSLETNRQSLVGSPAINAANMKQVHDHNFKNLMMKSFPNGDFSKYLFRAKVKSPAITPKPVELNVLDQSLSINTDLDVNLDTLNNIFNSSKVSYVSTLEETARKENITRQVKALKESLEEHDLDNQQDELKRIQMLSNKKQLSTEFFGLFKNRDIFLQSIVDKTLKLSSEHLPPDMHQLQSQVHYHLHQDHIQMVKFMHLLQRGNLKDN